MAAAVAAFQSLRGIVPDSILGPETVEALNVPASARVTQIMLNLERHRWMPDRSDARAIEVNIPSFELWARENGRTVLHMPVIVGQPSWESPVFSDRMDHLILNPHWNVPESIAADEILPAIAKDPKYLEKHDLEVVAPDGETVVPIRKVNWAEFTDHYTFRQRPGPRNALGRIKFMFPNQFNVYLHDTPAQPLFEETDRAFSHGCIRVSQPLELAEWVMNGRWTRRQFAEEIETGEQRTIALPEPVPVHILYWTAFVDDAGRLQFHQDIYGVDAALANSLAGRRASPASAAR
jgi:murein L,D-transpeptidase YcbB/YkuD